MASKKHPRDMTDDDVAAVIDAFDDVERSNYQVTSFEGRRHERDDTSGESRD